MNVENSNFKFSNETKILLRKLAKEQHRSMTGVIEHMVKVEAMKAGIKIEERK